MSDTSPPTDDLNRAADLIEEVLEAHALISTGVEPYRHREFDLCRCGTRHPTFDSGRWPTHSRHQALEIARAQESHLSVSTATEGT